MVGKNIDSYTLKLMFSDDLELNFTKYCLLNISNSIILKCMYCVIFDEHSLIFKITYLQIGVYVFYLL